MIEYGQLAPVFAAYPRQCQPLNIVELGSAGGFSGARIWRVDTPRGLACLRRWPPGHPTRSRLEFIQAVLWHVDQEGFKQVPVPWETTRLTGYVEHEGHYWELTPWMPGVADYRLRPSPEKLQAAMAALARFHIASATFPLPDLRSVESPGMIERRERMLGYLHGGADELAAAIKPAIWPEFAERAHRLVGLFAYAAPQAVELMNRAVQVRVELQACIRDIWHDHILFTGDFVTGVIDFGSMRPECVAADLARLLGSLAGDDRDAWRLGLAAYERRRPLTEAERSLIAAFDRSSVLMSGLQWLQWVYLERRTYDEPRRVIDRLDEILARLASLVEQPR